MARASLPIVTPDRFKQAHHKSKVSVAKMVGTIDFLFSGNELLIEGEPEDSHSEHVFLTVY
ncbi:hypothetical protein YERSI8AC_440021 [Enterobacterales bacterium 8AC]|nr:hypothetical protein YERSI8AC_440021 [Enterobacterales bacterium 8AC]